MRPEYFEIPIETPIQPKMDVSPFQRVLVAGFVAGGSEDVDTNQETVRLLRSQLRTKSSLKVIDADVMPLIEIAQDQSKTRHAADDAAASRRRRPAGTARRQRRASAGAAQALPLPQDDQGRKGSRTVRAAVRQHRVLEEDRRGISEPADRHRHGAVHARIDAAGFVQRDQEIYDSFGRRSVVPMRTYMERKGFVLRPKFVFIDGRTGATMYSESYREEILYNAQQNTPALSSYFELMDRLVPNFLSALSSQKIRGTRVLLN